MITDEMLRIAAAEADQAIRESLPSPADCDHQFSSEFERKMRHVIRRGRHPVAYKYMPAVPFLPGYGINIKTMWSIGLMGWPLMKKRRPVLLPHGYPMDMGKLTHNL